MHKHTHTATSKRANGKVDKTHFDSSITQKYRTRI